MRTLGLSIVHAVLPRQRLYEALQRHVPPHVVALPDGALHLPISPGTRFESKRSFFY